MQPYEDPRRTDPHGRAAQALDATENRQMEYDPDRHADTFTPPTLSPAGRHFVELARGVGTSGGVQAARHMAYHIIEKVPYLDNEALAGMCEFAVLAATYPQTMRAMLNQETT